MRVYIAGPYQPKNCSMHSAPKVTQQNVNHAIDAFYEIVEDGHEPYVPHLSHYIHLRGDVDLEADFWYKYDMSFLDHWAEAIYMLKGWEDSYGSRKELERAKELKLRVVYEEYLRIKGEQ